MKVLLTGANGYIGQRLLPTLLAQGHEVYCCVRNKRRFEAPDHPNIHLIEVDFLQPKPTPPFPQDLDAAYFLVHSMSTKGDFAEMEAQTAENFVRLVAATSCRQIIYLSGMANEDVLSKHLRSRLHVENILRNGPVPTTVLRAAIIVGSGSASFEIIRDLVEKLPIMITPKWLNTLCQPIAVRNVLQFLAGVLLKETTFNQDFDIGGPEVLSYKQMLLQFAEVRQLKRRIWTLPVMSPRISSYWLYFITSTSYYLAKNLVASMKVNVVCRSNDLAAQLGIELLPYKSAVELAFEKIEQNLVASSWKDAFSSFGTNPKLMDYVEVPKFGCFTEAKTRDITGREALVIDRIWRLGGDQGWYYGNILWRARGFLDKLFGGVGLRRGRTHPDRIHPGDTLDFWRVLVADRKACRLLLYAEMKLPGEAWLEFSISEKDGASILSQTATYRPLGIAGRLYWYAMLPFHHFLFDGMVDKLTDGSTPDGVGN